MQVEFSVGAKAARLIGRENIADVDGALIELIKNAYDADATCVWVNFSMPFPDVPDKISVAKLQEILDEQDFLAICRYYKDGSSSGGGTILEKREDLTEEERQSLQDIFFKYNQIIVLDNGSGMSADVVKSSWMYIGTSNKEVQVVSPKRKRVRTGAKGIGRFALDKLSTFSQMYTQEESAVNTLCWSVDWDQFAKVRLINEVKASLDETTESYEAIVKRLTGAHFTQLAEYDWSSGTAIVLSPVREAWSDRLFGKVNTNLRSINPIGSVDQFDVIIHNEYAPEYNYKTEKVAISKEDYDYRIKINFDGDKKLVVKLLRNEVDINKRTVKVSVKIPERSKVCQLSEFWQRPALQKKPYFREDYDKEIVIEKDSSAVLSGDGAERIREVGPFSAELYFLRNLSNEHEIMKKVNSKKRRALLEQFSGVKIYRDDFKVRPYGDEGPMQDWIGMGTRAQKSPASVAHPTGAWRVQPYQLIGFVRISRENNPLLQDMANREGIALNNAYFIFVDLLRECLKEFEYDRQYIYREYAKWIDEQEKSLQSNTDKVKAAAAARAQQKGEQGSEGQPDQDAGSGSAPGSDPEGASGGPNDTNGTNDGSDGFTRDDYLGAVYDMMQNAENELNSKQMLQILSSSGIVLNTFFHEFNAINTQFHVRASQLKSRINYLLKGKEYTGLAAYDPYRYVENTIEKNDRLVAAILDVIMQGMKKPNLTKQTVSLRKITGTILEQWEPLLAEKHIIAEPDEHAGEEDCVLGIAMVDWYIILNNFLLNSAWFLEQETNPDRRIRISLKEVDAAICVDLENNGPPLAEKYKSNPDIIFELGETSKEYPASETGNDQENQEKKVGTGLGLWVTREVVERYGGTVHVKDMEHGFGLQIIFPK